MKIKIISYNSLLKVILKSIQSLIIIIMIRATEVTQFNPILIEIKKNSIEKNNKYKLLVSSL